MTILRDATDRIGISCRWLLCAIGIVLALSPAALRADIVGTYLVEGVRPETGEPYRGSVTIERIGEKYAVTWDIEGSERVGVGLGGAFSGGNFMVGPAHPDDLMITIGFRDGDVTGIATMFWQDTREYEGFYVESDKDIAGFEIWSIDD